MGEGPGRAVRAVCGLTRHEAALRYGVRALVRLHVKWCSAVAHMRAFNTSFRTPHEWSHHRHL